MARYSYDDVEGILEGIGYFTILAGEGKKEILPRPVVDFMKREMFKGVDGELIETVSNEVTYGKET